MQAKKAKFPLGQLTATPGVIAAMAATGEFAVNFIARHASGDWGTMDAHDQRANDRAIDGGERIFSAYVLRDGTKIWVITEADRSSTCVMLPSEY